MAGPLDDMPAAPVVATDQDASMAGADAVGHISIVREDVELPAKLSRRDMPRNSLTPPVVSCVSYRSLTSCGRRARPNARASSTSASSDGIVSSVPPSPGTTGRLPKAILTLFRPYGKRLVRGAKGVPYTSPSRYAVMTGVEPPTEPGTGEDHVKTTCVFDLPSYMRRGNSAPKNVESRLPSLPPPRTLHTPATSSALLVTRVRKSVYCVPNSMDSYIAGFVVLTTLMRVPVLPGCPDPAGRTTHASSVKSVILDCSGAVWTARSELRWSDPPDTHVAPVVLAPSPTGCPCPMPTLSAKPFPKSQTPTRPYSERQEASTEPVVFDQTCPALLRVRAHTGLTGGPDRSGVV